MLKWEMLHSVAQKDKLYIKYRFKFERLKDRSLRHTLSAE